jgi:hypothetical protein
MRLVTNYCTVRKTPIITVRGRSVIVRIHQIARYVIQPKDREVGRVQPA